MPNEPHRWNELQAKLKGRVLKKQLAAHAEKVRKDIRRGLNDEFNAPLSNHLAVELFDELVIQTLTEPRIVTAEDLAETFFHQVTIGKSSAFEENYVRFLLVVRLAICERSSRPIEVLRYQSSEFLDLSVLKESPDIWKSGDDFSLEFNGILFEDIRFYEGHSAYFSLIGFCSERAMDVAAESAREAVSALLQSFELLAERRDAEKWVSDLALLNAITGQATVSDGTGAQSPSEDDPATLEEPWSGNYFLSHLQTLIDAYFGQPKAKSKDHTFDNRIRNACHLLVAADRQTSNAIGLSLSVTAIEILLCKDSDAISQRLAENIANLFEPELAERFKAFSFAKKLYGKRCKVFHGEATDFSAAERKEARLTAAAVLLAILERQQFNSRTNQQTKEKPDDFFKRLDAHRYTEGPFVGVPISPITYLWRDPPK